MLGVERKRNRLDASVALDIRAAGAVEHDLRDARISKQRFEWAEPDDLVGELSEETLQTSGSEERFLAPEQFDEATAQRLGCEARFVTTFRDDAAVHTLHEGGIARSGYFVS